MAVPVSHTGHRIEHTHVFFFTQELWAGCCWGIQYNITIVRANELALLGRHDHREGFPNISWRRSHQSGISSEGEKRDSKGDMPGHSSRVTPQTITTGRSTQQRLLCSGASVSDSAEGDLLDR